MRNGRNATRRNRNIGTVKQGHGNDNELVIPQPRDMQKRFFERFTQTRITEIQAHGMIIPVIVEELKEGYYYSCTEQDVERMLNHTPAEDLQAFGVIVFRKPKRKESLLSPVWGRLIYSFEFKDNHRPAIIIEAMPRWNTLHFPKKQSVDDKLEFELLKLDGLKFKESKRDFVADIDPNTIRNIQLYRTLLHEVGHYVHYLEVVERPRKYAEDQEVQDNRREHYFSISKNEKEIYANDYASNLKRNLMRIGVVPFDRIE